MIIFSCQNCKTHRSEGRERLKAHERDRGRKDSKMEGLQDKKKRQKELTKEGGKEGKGRKWVRHADRQWRLLQLDTAD